MSFAQTVWHVRLPSSASSFQNELAHVDAKRLSSINPEIIATLWDPYKCPTNLLAYLAWALSVDVWSNEWTEPEKRRAIAAAPQIHRLKGTRGAVERAVRSIGLDYKIIEWFEVDPPARRGTFQVSIFYDDPNQYWSLILRERALNAVRSSKPKSRVAFLSHRMRLRGEIYAGVLLRSTQRVRLRARAIETEPTKAKLGIAVSMRHTIKVTLRAS